MSAQVEQEPTGIYWSVTVSLSRPKDEPAIEAHAVSAELRDEHRRVLKQLTHPTEPQPEVGESLRMVSERHFQFESSGSPPTRLLVTYGRHKAVFRLASRKNAGH
jgi:hypothetical protein